MNDKCETHSFSPKDGGVPKLYEHPLLGWGSDVRCEACGRTGFVRLDFDIVDWDDDVTPPSKGASTEQTSTRRRNRPFPPEPKKETFTPIKVQGLSSDLGEGRGLPIGMLNVLYGPLGKNPCVEVAPKGKRGPRAPVSEAHVPITDLQDRGWDHFGDPFEIQALDISDRFNGPDRNEQARKAHQEECGCGWPDFDYHYTIRTYVEDLNEVAEENGKVPAEIQEIDRLTENRGADFVDGMKNGHILNAATKAIDLSPVGSVTRNHLEHLMVLLKEVDSKLKKGEISLKDFGYAEDWELCDFCSKPFVPNQEGVEACDNCCVGCGKGKPGYFNNLSLTGGPTEIERCDICKKYPSDEAAAQAVKEKGSCLNLSPLV